MVAVVTSQIILEFVGPRGGYWKVLSLRRPVCRH